MLGLDMPQRQPLSWGFQIQTLFQNFISININQEKIRKILTAVIRIRTKFWLFWARPWASLRAHHFEN